MARLSLTTPDPPAPGGAMIRSIVVCNLHQQMVRELGCLLVSDRIAAGGQLPREEVLAGRMKVRRTLQQGAMKVPPRA